ncbi:iron-containing alcohol dehydrogenase [Cupriavidus metallidurans]|uniref:iron-containing alcohol dehydrogenase n=1 Tax=Cupriavidus metallidurans TaxID=119219 RepID=UPI00164485F9|nr:iron-containing alcohol dehydrogenase [Cupriavidus metallidurans]
MYEFDAIQRNVRIHSGRDALAALPDEMRRLGARRAFLVSGRSVAAGTDLVDRIRGLIGDHLVGGFHAIRKDAPASDVEAAVAAAKVCQADLLLAIGAGSVIKAVRVISILLSEAAPMRALCTQYPEGGAPVSPKLPAAKLPIVNILTAPTSAQNRAGSALKDDLGGARLEFFDPKTRPASIFWDAGALMTAPESLIRSTGFSVYWRALMNVGTMVDANPLVQGDRSHAHRLAMRSLARAVSTPEYGARIDLCAAALLQNRDEDDGGRPFDTHRIARIVYALAAPIFNRHETVNQAEAHAALTAATIRMHGDVCPSVVSAIGRAIVGQGDGRGQDETAMSPAVVADVVEQQFRSFGMGVRLRDLGLETPDWGYVIAQAQRNFNADRAREFADETERRKLEKTLEAAW